MGGGLVTSIFLLHISFSKVEISLYVEFHPPGLPKSCSFMVGDKQTKNKRQDSIELMASLASSSG